jgi:hypothetical protein
MKEIAGPANNLAKLLTIFCVLSIGVMIPFLPCNERDCASSRLELIRFADLPQLPDAQSTRLRRYANSEEHCAYCFRGRVSMLRRSVTNWPDFQILIRRIRR